MSLWQMPQASTRMRTSPDCSSGMGRSTSLNGAFASAISTTFIVAILALSDISLSAAIGKTTRLIQDEAKVGAERLNGRFMFWIWVTVRLADDNHSEVRLVSPGRRQHRRNQCLAIGISQCEKYRHLALKMRLQ